MNTRKLFFRLICRKDYREINNNMNFLTKYIYNPTIINEVRLEEFLNKISNKSTFYYNLKNKSFQEYPIMDKVKLRENLLDISTMSYSEFSDFPFRKTSGSYGTPFKFYVTREKLLSQRSQILYFGKWSGFGIGIKHLYIRSLEPSIKNEIIKNQYILKPEKVNEYWINSALNEIKKIKPKVIIGYPTTLEFISRKINAGNYSFPFLKGIITSGENLTESARTEITKAFKIVPHSRYSTEELGVLGNTFGNGSSMILNQVDFLIEILDTNDNPVSEGEVGRVIVTDFNSDIIPLVRYDTGDLARVSKYKGDLVTEISNLEGRTVEVIFDTNGEMLTPYAINIKMRDYEDIQQFQFIQESENEYTLRIKPVNKLVETEYTSLISHLEYLLGETAKVTLEKVKEIEALPSGKRPYIINRTLQAKKNEL